MDGVLQIIKEAGFPIAALVGMGYIGYKLLLPFFLEQIKSNQQLMREHLEKVSKALENTSDALEKIKESLESLDKEIKKPRRR